MSSSASSAPTPSSSSRRLFFALAFRLVRFDAAAYCSSSIAAVDADRLCPAPLPLPDPDDLDPAFFEAPGATAGLLEPRLPFELAGGLITAGDAVLAVTRSDEWGERRGRRCKSVSWEVGRARVGFVGSMSVMLEHCARPHVQIRRVYGADELRRFRESCGSPTLAR